MYLHDDRRVTLRCIVNEDSGMRKFRLTNRGTDKPCCKVNEYSGTAGSRSLAWWLSHCPLLPGAVRRQTLTLHGIHFFVCLASFRAGLKKWYCIPLDTIQFFRDTLRGLHDVLVFRHFLDIWFLDIFWQFYEYYSRKSTKDREVIFPPVVDTCKFCQKRWFVMMWLHMEPLQPISNKKDVLC